MSRNNLKWGFVPNKYVMYRRSNQLVRNAMSTAGVPCSKHSFLTSQNEPAFLDKESHWVWLVQERDGRVTPLQEDLAETADRAWTRNRGYAAVDSPTSPPTPDIYITGIDTHNMLVAHSDGSFKQLIRCLVGEEDGAREESPRSLAVTSTALTVPSYQEEEATVSLVKGGKRERGARAPLSITTAEGVAIVNASRQLSEALVNSRSAQYNSNSARFAQIRYIRDVVALNVAVEKEHRSALLQEEKNERKRFLHVTKARGEQIRQQEIISDRVQRKEKRRQLRQAREEAQLRLLLARHAEERAFAYNTWDVVDRLLIMKDEIWRFEDIMRRRVISYALSYFRMLGCSFIEGKKAIVKHQEQLERAERAREAVWLEMFMSERQLRTEEQSKEQLALREIHEKAEHSMKLIRHHEMEKVRKEDEERRRHAEKQANERYAVEREEVRFRNTSSKEEEKERFALLEARREDQFEVNKLIQYRLTEERRRRQQEHERARQIFMQGNEAARTTFEREVDEAWCTLLRLEVRSLEYIHRPLDLRAGLSPEWVLGDTNISASPLCPRIEVAPRLQTPVGHLPIHSAFVHISSIDECDVNIELSSVSADARIASTEEEADDKEGEKESDTEDDIGGNTDEKEEPSILREEGGFFFKYDTTPARLYAARGRPETSQEELGYFANPGSIRVDFSNTDPSEGIDPKDIQNVLRFLTFFIQDAPDNKTSVTVRIYVHVAYISTDEDAGHSLLSYDLHRDVDVSLVEPLFSVDASAANLGYLLSGDRKPMQLLPTVHFPNIHLPEAQQRSYTGGTIHVKYIDGVKSEDCFTLSGLVKSGTSKFEGQDLRVKRLDDVKKRVRGAKKSAIRETGFDVLLPKGVWPEARVRRLLQTLTYHNTAPLPHRPKRVIEIQLFESPHRDTNRPQGNSLLTVEVNILFGEDGTFWLLNGDRGSPGMGGDSTRPKAPFKVYRHTNRNRVQDHDDVNGFKTVLCPWAVLQNQHNVTKFLSGHLKVCINSCSAGDTLGVLETEGIQLGQDKTLVYQEEVLASVTSFTGTQHQQASLRVEFNQAEPYASIEFCQALLRSICFSASIRPKLGQRSITMEMVVVDTQAKEQTLRASVGVRVLPPCAEVTPSSGSFSYTENQGWRRVGIFDCGSGTERREEEVINFFDSGCITIAVVDGGNEEDHLTLQEPSSGEFFITAAPGKTSERCEQLRACTPEEQQEIRTIKIKPKTLNEEAKVVGQFKQPARGEPLQIYLGQPNVGWEASISGDGELEVRRDGAHSHSSEQPRVVPKLLKSILGCVAYSNVSEDARELEKAVKIFVSDWTGASSCTYVDVSIVPVNDPTEIVLEHKRITYRQSTESSKNGLQLFPGARLEDVDTEFACPGAFMEVELVAGDMNQEIIIVGREVSAPPDEHESQPWKKELNTEVTHFAKKLYIGSELAGTVYSKDKSLGRGPTVGVTFDTLTSLAHCTAVLQAFTYSNVTYPVKVGIRCVLARFNAGDGVCDSKAKLDIDILAPVLWAPSFTRQITYTEAGPPVPLNVKIMSGLPPSVPLAGGSMSVRVHSGFCKDEDVIDFSNPQIFAIEKGMIMGRALGSKGHILGILSEHPESAEVVVAFPRDSQATVKHLNALFRAFKYSNRSNDPNTEPRKVYLKLELGDIGDKEAKGGISWPTSGLGSGEVEVVVEVVAVDDQTEVTPAYSLVSNVMRQDRTFVFKDCDVSDPDTPVFHAPYSYFDVLIVGPERLSLSEHHVSIGEHALYTMIPGDACVEYEANGAIVARSEVSYESRGIKLYIELLACPLEVVRALVQNVVYSCHREMPATGHASKYTVVMNIRGGARVAPTKTRVQV